MGLKRLVNRIINWATNTDLNHEYIISKGSNNIRPSPPQSIEFDENRGINFTIFSASGGKVIQTRIQDQRTGNIAYSLYIIPDKEDLGEELAQIITRESLAR